MSIFGQVWLWSLLAFAIGALLAWLVLVLPAQKRIQRLESQLARAHAEGARPPGQPAEATRTAYLSRPSIADTEVPRYQKPERFEVPEAEVAEQELEAWTEAPKAQYEPEPQPQESPVTEFISRIEPEPEPVREEPVTSRAESPFQPDSARFQPEPHWFDRELVPERSPFEEPAARHYSEPEIPPVAEHLQPEPPKYAFEESEVEVPGGAETSLESTQVLPKRQRRESPPGGFDSPKPIEPSMRAVERREPFSDSSGGYSGSLFEPAVPPGQHYAASSPEPPPARHQAAVDSVPPGPFGPGSAMPRPGGGRPSEEFAVKASVTALRYCTEESPQFARMVAEVWFRTPVDAERVGFRPLT
jgi:hypothetical protein